MQNESTEWVEKHNQLLKTIRKLGRFANYQNGWDLGRGVALDQGALLRANFLLVVAYNSGLWRSNAFPSPSGDVMLTVTQGDHDVEIVVHSDGTYGFNYEVDDERLVEFDELVLGQIKAIIKLTATVICSSERSTQKTISTGTRADFEAQHSNPPVMAVSQFSTMNAPLVEVTESVSTYSDTIQTPVGIQQYSGASEMPIDQMELA